MNYSGIKTLLQFANKANKIGFGFSWLKINYKKAKLAIIATDFSSSNKEKANKILLENNIKSIECFSKAELGNIFNRNEVGIIIICDTNFAKGIEKNTKQ